jgi:hypothetical protein
LHKGKAAEVWSGAPNKKCALSTTFKNKMIFIFLITPHRRRNETTGRKDLQGKAIAALQIIRGVLI